MQGARTRPYKLQLIDDFCSCNDELFEEVGELKRLASDTVQEVWNYARDLGQYVLNGRRIEELDKNEYNSLKATLLQAWNAAFEVLNFLFCVTLQLFLIFSVIRNCPELFLCQCTRIFAYL